MQQALLGGGAGGLGGASVAEALGGSVPATATATAVAEGTEASGDEGSAGEGSDRMPSATESTDGTAPEITVHHQGDLADASELSPEEQAIQGLSADENADQASKPHADEDSDTAALAEGRAQPPKSSRPEPA